MSQRQCGIEGCGKPYKAHGLCNTHNERRRLGLALTEPVRQYERGERVCKVEGCGKPRDCDGTYCQMHQKRISRRGDIGEADRERSPFGEAVWTTPEYRRDYNRRVKYGLTRDEFDRMLASQNSRCAICGTDDPRSARSKSDSWNVDHDHVTKRVRGLLCGPCNMGLGSFEDDDERMAEAIRYLKKHRKAHLSSVKDA